MDVVINYWAVLTSAVAAIVLGALWYGPFFGKQWMHIIGITMTGEMTNAARRSMVRSYAIQTVTVLVMAFVMAHVLFFVSEIFGVEGVFGGITAAIWIWLGFVAPVTIGSVLWENRPWRYWFITAGYYFITLSMMGVIFAVWQ